MSAWVVINIWRCRAGKSSMALHGVSAQKGHAAGGLGSR